MPKYLVTASYSADGAKGLLADGGTGRREAVKREIQSCGGTLEWMYFAFGEHDLYVVVDIPDNVSMAAISIVARSSGAVHSKAVPLLSPEDLDAATKKQVDYRPPGA
ncbi:GYD domain-containing protein [Streptomyces sp. NA02950]|uniref:GYD domain-containing protein n=1 Tax=Streptomyces sp. NA02950 TaxID=2742137 RepID=UPI001591EC7A|nr:GYD domain-containing protein [Streptomyces sp. NA02950]QKV90645.1 GYD domain-containing protein [Streptomyces sp. NA02950]